MAEVLSGQTAVAEAGTEVVLATAGTYKNVCVAVKALAANTGKMYIGNNGSGAVASTTGYELAAGDQVVFENVDDLGNILVDASVNGEKVCWLILGRH